MMKDAIKAIGIICGVITVPVLGSLAIGASVYKVAEVALRKRTEKKQRQDEVTQVLKIVIEHK